MAAKDFVYEMLANVHKEVILINNNVFRSLVEIHSIYSGSLRNCMQECHKRNDMEASEAVGVQFQAFLTSALGGSKHEVPSM